MNMPPTSSIKRIEQITRREALCHAGAAWDAHQRLMRRCLRLKLGPFADDSSKKTQMDAKIDVASAAVIKQVNCDQDVGDGHTEKISDYHSSKVQMDKTTTVNSSLNTSSTPKGPIFQGVELIPGMRILVKWISDEVKSATIARFKMVPGKKTLIYIAFGDEITEKDPLVCVCSVNRIVKILSSPGSPLQLYSNHDADITILPEHCAEIEPKEQSILIDKREEHHARDKGENNSTAGEEIEQNTNESIETVGSANIDPSGSKNLSYEIVGSMSHDSTDTRSSRKRRRPAPAATSTRNIILQHYTNLQGKKR